MFAANPQLLTPMAPSHAIFGYMDTGSGAAGAPLYTPALTPIYNKACSPDMTLTQPLAAHHRFPSQSMKMNGPIGLGISMPGSESTQQMALTPTMMQDDVFRVPQEQQQFMHHNMIYPTA